MNDPLDQIAKRWAACEGFLSPRVSGAEEDTDIEYRGRAGKWTLATVFDTDESTGQAWLQAFLHARADVTALLAEVRRLQVVHIAYLHLVKGVALNAAISEVEALPPDAWENPIEMSTEEREARRVLGYLRA